MNYSRYLSAIAVALRDNVQPTLAAGRVYDTVGACIRALAAIAESQAEQPEAVLRALDELSLVPELRAALAEAAPQSLDVPAEDLTVRSNTMGLMAAGARWLSQSDWTNHRAAVQSAQALLRWSRELSVQGMHRLDAIERRKTEAGVESGSVADVSADAIQRYLRQSFGSPSLELSDFRFLTGGRVRQTVSFTISADGNAPSKLVVQREHPGAITALRGLSMQFALLSQLHAAGVKVPKPLLIEESAAHLGAPFIVVERLPGAPPIASMDYFGTPSKSVSIVESLAEQMALLHRQPIEALEVHLDSTLDRATDQSWASDVDVLERTWLEACHAPSLAVSAGLAWMRSRAADIGGRRAIVHGDMLLHNLLTEDEKISGILDWELAHLGHPAEDLGYVRPVIEQMADWSLFMQAYQRAGGTAFTAEEIDFFTLRSMIKLITIIQPARMAFETGRTDDANLVEAGASFLPKLIDRLSGQVLRVVSNLGP